MSASLRRSAGESSSSSSGAGVPDSESPVPDSCSAAPSSVVVTGTLPVEDGSEATDGPPTQARRRARAALRSEAERVLEVLVVPPRLAGTALICLLKVDRRFSQARRSAWLVVRCF